MTVAPIPYSAARAPVSVVAPVSAPLVHQPGGDAQARTTAPMNYPGRVGSNVQARRVAPTVPVAPQIAQTVAPIAYAMQQYKETGNPWTAAAEGFVNAQSQIESTAKDKAKRESAAELLKDHPDLQQQVANGTVELSDALSLAKDSDAKVAAEQRKQKIITFLQKSGDTSIAELYANDILDEDGVAKMLATKDNPDTEESWFGTPIYMKRGDKTIVGQISNKGNFRESQGADDLQPAVPVQQLNTGTEFVGVDKYGNPTGSTTAINNEQAERDKTKGAGEGKLDAERPMLRSKAQGAIDALTSQHDLVNEDIDRVLSDISDNPWFTTGAGALTNQWLPGSPADQVSKLLETIKANVGFDKLQAMREASPTGGALGQVSDFENRQLQSVMGNLAQSQKTEDLVYNLRRLKDILAESKQARVDAFNRDFAEGGGSQAADPSDPLGLKN